MKKSLIYTAALLAAACVAPSCSMDGLDTNDAAATGTISLKVSATRAAGDETSGAYNPLNYKTVRIYNNSDELLRRYTDDNLPDRLELLTGNYRAVVAVGQEEPATFEKKFYKGETNFAVAAGSTTSVEVECKRQNVAAAVKFDATVAENFGSTAKVWIAAATDADYAKLGQGSLDELTYTADGTGYFMLPEGVTTLIYKFQGTHNDASRGESGVITSQGILTGVTTGANCSLSFKFSPDAPGYIQVFTILVDDSAEEVSDDIIWTDISITGDGFDAETQQDYIPGKSNAVTYNITNITPIRDVTLRVGSTTYNLTTTTYPGIAVTRTNDRNMTVTLDDEFFSGIGGGTQSVRIRVRDTSNGELSRTTPFRVQGLLPVSESDYNLWTNSVTLKALVLDQTVSEVNFTLGSKNAAGVAGTDNIYTASFRPEWTLTPNADNASYPSYYLPVEGTGVFAGNSYTCGARIGSTDFSGSFSVAAGQTIPGGDIEDGSMSCFTQNNSASTMWGSGNNSNTKGLCTPSTKSGMNGSQCAKLAATSALGILAAGNLFTGTFSFNFPNGTVGFGQKYDYTARPKALHFKYHAKIGTVNSNKHGGPLTKDVDTDISNIYVAIVDWSARHNVVSGLSGCSGVWSPDAQTDLDGSGKIIAYGIMDIRESTSGDSMIDGEIPLRYYDTACGAPEGNYTIVISCSTSKYGDYMNGYDGNVLYIDDFAWGY